MTLAPLILPEPDDTEEWVRRRTEEGLTSARAIVAELVATPPTDALEALRRYDEAGLHLSNVGAMGSLLSNVHPEQAVRDAAERAEQEVMRLRTELSLDRDLFALVDALDGTDLDAEAARLLEKIRLDFARAGVDRDEETRARITAIQERMTTLDQELGRAIRDDVRTVRVEPERLAGLPLDWLEAHPVDGDGLVAVTTDYPDSVPVRMFAHDADVRREMTVAFLNRGWPTTDPLLHELFALRHELATLVGHADWAAYDAQVKMIGTGPAIPAFIDRIAEAAEQPMRRDLDVLLERCRRDDPDATEISGADGQYYLEQVRKELFEVDSQEVRRYFAFTKVHQGLLDVTARLFGVRCEPVTDAVTWHADVTTYDVVLDDAAARRIGRIHLDLHPREGKYKHAAQFTLTEGVAGRQLPEGVLVCNFSRALMEHTDVVTLFHEFGHLLHHVLGGGGRGRASPGSRPSGTSSRRRARCSRSGPGTPRCCRASPPTSPGRRSRPRSSSGCARARTSVAGSTPGPRCSTPRCPTGSTWSGPMTWSRGCVSCRSATHRSPTSRTLGCSPASATSSATPRPTTPTCGRS